MPPQTKSKRRRSDSSSSSDSSDSSSSDSSNDYKKKKSRSDENKGSSDDSSKNKAKVEKTSKNIPKQSSEDRHHKSDKKDAKSSEKTDHSRSYKRDLKAEERHDDDKPKYRDKNDRDRRNDGDRYKRNDEADRHRRNDGREDSTKRNDRYDDYRGDRQRRDDRDRERYDHSREKRGSQDRDRRDNRNGRRNRSRSRSFDHSNAKWGREDSNKSKGDSKPNSDKQKPNFGLSGKLTEETNTYKGVVIKYSEPPEARKPKRRWRLYPFKGEKALQTLYIHRESAYLIGRERKVVDLAVDHPSCSKQHAALQYRLVPFTRDDGSTGKRVRPYLIDLESANGTFINNKKIEPKKYVELLERDVIKFGFSSREYVLLHENSKDEAQDDDVKLEDEVVEVKQEKNT